MTEEQKSTARKLYNKGMNDVQISAEFGVSSCTIRRLRNRLGLPAIGVARPTIEKKVTDAQLVEWVGERLSIKEMAARGGVACSTISKRLMKLKVNGSATAQANREAAERGCESADAFLAAFKPGFYLPPTNSRMAATSNRDGSRIIGLPVAICTASSLYGA